MDTTSTEEHTKRGYLNQDFSVFNLEDMKQLNIESHYHDFHKIVVFISGRVTYYVEGTGYKLKPGDILLINSDSIHKPLIDSTSPYKRMVIWFHPIILQQYSPNLLTCFELAKKYHANLIRITPDMPNIVQSTLSQIKDTLPNTGFGDELLRKSLFLQLMIHINRMALTNKKNAVTPDDIEYDDRVNKMLNYIELHLADDLSIEKLASVFFISKYYLMRKFKQHTGYSIHQYILQKRLIRANQLMDAGRTVINACLESGFRDYSSFTRAFKKTYGLSPSKYQHVNH